MRKPKLRCDGTPLSAFSEIRPAPHPAPYCARLPREEHQHPIAASALPSSQRPHECDTKNRRMPTNWLSAWATKGLSQPTPEAGTDTAQYPLHLAGWPPTEWLHVRCVFPLSPECLSTSQLQKPGIR